MSRLPRTRVSTRLQGGRLRLLRTLHGYTLDQLGKEVHTSGQYIQALEKGSKQPSQETLQALCSVLKVKPRFFFRSSPRATDRAHVHFRRRRSRTPQRACKSAEALLDLLSEIIDHAEHLLALPPLNVPLDYSKARHDIERVAEQCRIYWGLRVDAPITSITAMLELIGAVVVLTPHLPSGIDASSMYGERPIVVRNSVKHSATRLRFDLAHECGHILLHRDQATDNTHSEAEADLFAASLLLPRMAFVREFRAGNSELDWSHLFQLKARWGASVAAIVHRAHSLGLISPANYKVAFIRIKQLGWYRVGEPQEPELERPQTLASCFSLLLRLCNGSLVELASALDWEPELLELVLGTLGEDTPIPTLRDLA